MFCTNCGKEKDSDAVFCTRCGGRIQVSTNVGLQSYYFSWSRNQVTNINVDIVATVLKKMEASCTIWMVISILQIIIGVGTICVGYGLFTLSLGIWNLTQTKKMRKNKEYFKDHPEGIYPYFEPREGTLIITLLLNLFFGAVIGCICMAYELSIRNYVMKHKNELV